MPKRGEHQADRQFGDAGRVRAAGGPERHAAFGERPQRQVVDAGPVAADRAQVPGARDHPLRDGLDACEPSDDARREPQEFGFVGQFTRRAVYDVVAALPAAIERAVMRWP